MILLGVDPGSRYTGWGVIKVVDRRMSCVSAGRIALTDKEHAKRLVLIYDGISSIVQEFQPDAAAIESVFVQKNVQSALKLGQARGVAMAACAQHGLVPYEISPRTVKQCVTGYGATGKVGVGDMVQRLLGMQQSLSVDAFDALAIAISASMHLSLNRRHA